jgi:hypothetical protein
MAEMIKVHHPKMHKKVGDYSGPVSRRNFEDNLKPKGFKEGPKPPDPVKKEDNK